MHPLLAATPEVEDALAAGRPVVALESTLIAHGMPFPANLEAARALESAVREAGAVPATVAVAGGKVRIGLDGGLLERLATEPGVAKLSRRDLPAGVVRGRLGATTVAATMAAAHLAGIRVFATGGIGGVHRGAELSFDVSADLEELARTPVAVVSAGAKAILDLPKTLEWLETRGVPVIGVGTDEFPAFWSRSSGLRVPLRVEGAAEAAALLGAQAALGYAGGALLANPIPETAALPRDEVEAAIAAALAQAAARGVAGPALTPFLLARVVEFTGGRSLEANLALALANARLAGEVAAALAASTVTGRPGPRAA